jgi:hypothetical protein
VAVVIGLAGPVVPVQAQGTVSGPILPLGGSTVSGDYSIGPNNQGAAIVTVRLGGLAPRSTVDVSVNAGTCNQPSTGLFPLFKVTANDAGQVAASGAVLNAQGAPLSMAELTGSNYILLVMANGQVTACGAIQASGGSDFASALLAEGERQQVMQFNPNAALQKRIFADGFVPNSAEFGTVVEGTSFAVQRAEHLRTGAVRAYFARSGDWGNVVFAQRGVSSDPLGLYMLAEADRHQAIRFNPNAALQKRIFADGFVPNSPEFPWQYAGVNYTAQRAEHLGTGRVRVYYAVNGLWNNVQFVQRGAVAPTPPPPPTPGPVTPAISFSPASGPSGTVVRVSGAGFAPFASVALWGAPVGSQGIQLATGITDGGGRVAFEVPVQGSPGMRWVFSMIAGQQYAQSREYTITQ